MSIQVGKSDNSSIHDVVGNRYLCTFSRFSFSTQIAESRLKKTKADLLGHEEKLAIKNKIEEIEKLTKEVYTLLGAD